MPGVAQAYALAGPTNEVPIDHVSCFLPVFRARPNDRNGGSTAGSAGLTSVG
ncbi:hypothetical protein D3C72_2208570 [compost metagenome]